MPQMKSCYCYSDDDESDNDDILTVKRTNVHLEHITEEDGPDIDEGQSSFIVESIRQNISVPDENVNKKGYDR